MAFAPLLVALSLLVAASSAATDDEHAVRSEGPPPTMQQTVLSEWTHEQKEMRKEAKKEAKLEKKEEHWKEKGDKMEASIEHEKLKVLHAQDKELQHKKNKSGVTDASKSTREKAAKYFKKAQGKQDHYKREEAKWEHKMGATRKEENRTSLKVQAKERVSEERPNAAEKKTKPMAAEDKAKLRAARKEHEQKAAPEKALALHLFIKTIKVASILALIFISLCIVTTSVAWWIRVKPHRNVHSAPPLLG